LGGKKPLTIGGDFRATGKFQEYDKNQGKSDMYSPPFNHIVPHNKKR
jgi:hypothetical protein